MIEVLIYFVCGFVLFSLAFPIGFGLWRAIEIPTRRWRDSVFDYVYVDDDGNVRELNAEEDDQVTTVLFPDDKVQFYVKPRYESLNPNGRLSGYLRRRELPPNASVGPPPSNAS